MRSLPLWKLNTPDSAQITTVTSASIAVIAVTVRRRRSLMRRTRWRRVVLGWLIFFPPDQQDG